ncbi:hypothetical protein GA0074695_3719 [Micromonospora viridifaciens]|uniref:LPXTG-motif cell wall anchor domain-containing protein n=1 Tax=Micromonospora viridifaciens TaxID=1881 RepID=A0A1C4XYQ1_MICVI|nr:hypothetical protein [Micromonospora viridifaciens]SCF13585.1 hypothetical protein GA0074695_3719 [Micromonospora viridifaciens]
MKAQRIVGSTAVGVGLGTLLLPAAALADTTVSPATTPVGGTVVLTTTECNPADGDALFHVTGPDRDQNVRSTTAAAGGGLSAELFTAGFTLGTYTVTTTCGNGSNGGTATFTVIPIGATPIGGAPAGAGGKDGDTGVLVTGGALAAAAVAGGAYVLVRRRRRAATTAA